MTAALLSLLIGLIIGYYAKEVWTKLSILVEEHKESREARNVGVVRPIGKPVTKNQPISLASQTGGILKPSPAAVEELRKAERDQILQDNHR